MATCGSITRHAGGGAGSQLEELFLTAGSGAPPALWPGPVVSVSVSVRKIQTTCYDGECISLSFREMHSESGPAC